jgi:hypothetical protein
MSKDDEFVPATSEARIHRRMVRLLRKRLAHETIRPAFHYRRVARTRRASLCIQPFNACRRKRHGRAANLQHDATSGFSDSECSGLAMAFPQTPTNRLLLWSHVTPHMQQQAADAMDAAFRRYRARRQDKPDEPSKQ